MIDEADSRLDATSECCAALIDALRVADAPPGVLAAVRTQLEAATALLLPFARPGPHSQSVPGVATQRFFEVGQLDPQALMPYSPIIGRLNPVSPRLEFRTEGDRLLGRGRIPVRFVGAPGTVHGGIVAAALDEIMGLVNVLNGEGAFTGTMSVRFHRPTPIERDLELLGETVGKDGRKILSRAEIRCDGELMASAEGVFIRPRGEVQPP
ncbi:MAG: PaaI family thioesterase [Gammaproteobacteria bacterium]